MIQTGLIGNNLHFHATTVKYYLTVASYCVIQNSLFNKTAPPDIGFSPLEDPSISSGGAVSRGYSPVESYYPDMPGFGLQYYISTFANLLQSKTARHLPGGCIYGNYGFMGGPRASFGRMVIFMIALLTVKASSVSLD